MQVIAEEKNEQCIKEMTRGRNPSRLLSSATEVPQRKKEKRGGTKGTNLKGTSLFSFTRKETNRKKRGTG